MNKSLAVSLLFSLGLHASTITLAKEGVILQNYLYDPKELIARAMANRQQMNLLFVDTVKQDLKGDKPLRTNVISDHDNVAQDRSLRNNMKGIAPDAGKPAGTKQLGDTSPVIGQAPRTVPGTEMMDDITVKPSMPAKPSAAKLAKKGKSGPPAPSVPKRTVEKKISYIDRIKKMESDVVLPEEAAKKADFMKEKGADKLSMKKEQKKDIVSLRKRIDDWMAEEEEKEFEETRGSEGSAENSPARQVKKRGQISLERGSLKKLSADENGDVDRFGDITFNANRYSLGHYFKKLKDKVENYWLPYLAFTYSGGNLFGNKTIILFRIYPSGEVKFVKVLEHHGDEVLKDFCISAITNTSPYDPLPEAFLAMTNYKYLPIVFTFIY